MCQRCAGAGGGFWVCSMHANSVAGGAQRGGLTSGSASGCVGAGGSPPAPLDAPRPGPPAAAPPQGYCWVLADNEQLAPPHVIDSRSFGPLPLASIVGRWAGGLGRGGQHVLASCVWGAAAVTAPPTAPAPLCPTQTSTTHRIVYCARSETDHGPVENSEDGMAADAPVLEAELDLDRLCNDE